MSQRKFETKFKIKIKNYKKQRKSIKNKFMNIRIRNCNINMILIKKIWRFRNQIQN